MGYFVTKLTSSTTRFTDEITVSEVIAKNVAFPIAQDLAAIPKENFAKFKPGFLQFQGNLAVAIKGAVERRSPFGEVERTLVEMLNDLCKSLGLSAGGVGYVIVGTAFAKARAIYEKSVGSE